MSRDIAIIGMAARMPQAVTIRQFYQNLREGKDCVKEMPQEVLCERNLPFDREYTAMGYLDDIDKFDYKFFNIPYTEAIHMDPVQRFLLELSYETIEDSGYNPDVFSNTRTAIYMSHADYSYGTLYLSHRMQEEPTMFTGNNHFAAAGRIARFFNFRGNALVINSGCSSALNALHLACAELISGEADFALVTGTRLTIISAEKNPPVFDIGIEAFDGKTRSFSDDSTGSGESEMVGCVLLKPLEKALADKDHIYAVIKSTVANQCGQLSSSLTATNSAAQAEMIKEAWEKAGIDPETVTYIEAHGSGTKLGDPIEIAGIDLAFQGKTSKKHFVAVSSVKTNIGHADTGAGMAGLLKAVLSIKHKELFASLNFNKPNPFIDFANSVTYINTSFKKWEPECGVLRAGVNSLGFTGNNVHVVLESPAEREIKPDTDGKRYLFTFSGKNREALKRNIQAFSAYLKENTGDYLRDISYTLTTGRKHYDHRFSVISNDAEELAGILEKELRSENPKNPAGPFKKLICVFSGNVTVSAELVDTLGGLYPQFRENYDSCIDLAGKPDENVRRFAFQYALYHVFKSVGLESRNLVGLGAGKHVVAVLTGKASLREALGSVLQIQSEEPSDLLKRLSALAEKETERENVLFIEVGPEAVISGNLRSLNTSSRDLYEVISLNPYAPDPILQLIKETYQLNFTLDWSRFGEVHSGLRIPLPAYQFEKVRCWIIEPTDPSKLEMKPKEQPTQTENPQPTPAGVISGLAYSADEFPVEWTPTERKIAQIWASVLNIKELKLTDDFFALGGHSLFLIQVNNRIEQEYRLKFEMKELFSFATVKSLAQAVDMVAKGGRKIPATVSIEPVEPQEYYPLSFAQKRLWILSQFDTSSVAYNLPEAYLFEGRLNKEALEKAYLTLIERHEVLRTVFVGIEGEPVQKILSAGELGFKLEEIDLGDRADGEEQARRLADEDAVTPFDLAKGPLLRAKLIRIGENRHVFLFNVHHIVGDGWSSQVIISEIITLYDAYDNGRPNPLVPLRIQYKDYAAWQSRRMSGEELKVHHDYWLKRFSGELPVLRLPSDKPRPAVQTFNGDNAYFRLDKDTTSRLSELTKSNGVTLFMTLLAGVKALFYKYTGQTDMIIGTPSAGRDHADLENQIGFYVNTLALRTMFSPADTFAGLLGNLKEVTLGAYEHQIYPLDRIVEELNLERDMSRSALLDVVVILHNMNANTAANESTGSGQPEMRIENFAAAHKVSQRDLTFSFTEVNGEIDASVEFNTDIYSHRWMETMISHFKALLAEVLENPHVRLNEIKAIPPSEKEKLKGEAAGTTGQVKSPSAPVPGKPGKAEYVAPRTEAEKKVVEIVESVLKIKPVGINDNFFEIGGHSLKAMRLIYKINKEMEAGIGLATIYAHPTIGELARAVSKDTVEEEDTPQVKDEGLPKAQESEYYDISYAQLNFLNGNPLIEDNVPGAMELEDVNEEAFIRAWQALIERHESLRTVFVNVDGKWKQKILPPNDPKFALELVDLVDSVNREEEVSRLSDEITKYRFDMSQGPLIRARLLRLGDRRHFLALTMSHAVSDGWTLTILKRDIDALYRAFSAGDPNPLKPLTRQYKDYSAWHNGFLDGPDADKHRSYWHARLKGHIPKLNLPVDFPEVPGMIGEHAIFKMAVPESFGQKLNSFAASRGVSLFSVMLAGMNTLLYRLTGQKDVLLSTAVATREFEELNDAVGFFVNILLIRKQIDENQTFSGFLEEVSRDFIEAMDHVAYPLEKLFGELGFGVNDFTYILLNTHNYPGQKLEAHPNLVSRHEQTHMRPRTHLACVFDEYSNGIEICWVYRKNLFRPETIEQIAEKLIGILDEAVTTPEIRIRKLGTTTIIKTVN